MAGLEGKVAVVTGAARMRAIGRAIAVTLAREGCDVVITGTSRSRDTFPPDEQEAGWLGLASVAEEIEGLGRRCQQIVTDRIDEPVADRVVAEVVAEFGGADILVNNAAAARGADRVPVVEMDVSAWQQVIDVNLTGTFLMSRAFGRLFTTQGRGGSIVNISSIGGKLMGARTGAYAASKAGVHALTSAMAQELGEYGIRVNAICPGIVRTARLDDLDDATWAQIIQTHIPLRRAGETSEIADLVAFLCSSAGAWVTGQAWNVDGGQLTIH
jgi:3-oxoacyl-[acyl-carrier protein] reductase